MASHLTGRNAALTLIALVLLGLLANSALRDEAGTVPAGSLVLDTPRQAPNPTPGTATGQQDRNGTLVLIQGLKARRLVVAQPGGEPPHEVDDHISAWPLLPSPTGTKVLYSTQHTVMALDLAARRADIVGTLPDEGHVVLAQWSPDGSALAYVVATSSHNIAYYTLADGSLNAVEMLRVPRGLPLDVGWFEGRPVGISLGIGPLGGLQASYQGYDPRTGAAFALPAGAAIIQPWAPWRSPDGTQQVYAATTWDSARSGGACGTGPLGVTGDEWLYLSAREDSQQHSLLFEQRGLFMDRPTWLPDGRILFRAMADEVCSGLGSGLYAARPGDALSVVVESSVGAGTEGADRLLWGPSYALRGDELAWSRNDLAAQRGTIHAAALAGGDARLLYETPRTAETAAFDFRDREAILYFVWLP